MCFMNLKVYEHRKISVAVAEVKRLILKHKLTKGDIRGNEMKQLEL